MRTYDVIVIGGGIAGVSIGYELAGERSVCLLEMEDRLAYHTTGRSVATFLESYGGRIIRMLTTSSRSFMTEPPDGFGRPLLSPLPLIWVAPHGQVDELSAMADSVAEFVTMERLSAAEVEARCPVFRSGWVAAGLHEPGASEVDVAALHAGYAGGLKRRGGEVRLRSGAVAIARTTTTWVVTDAAGDTVEAPVVIDAAGAWVDRVAALAGVAPIGIHPLRRTVFTFQPAASVDVGALPLVGDVSASFYFKPEGPNVLVSPADEVPSEPCDARVEEEDVARAIEVINAATTFDVRHVRSTWAGLRSFLADRSPVAGWAEDAEGFFWFAGQGGYGIQIAPALAAAGAAIVRGEPLPADVAGRRLTAADLAPGRLHGVEWSGAH